MKINSVAGVLEYLELGGLDDTFKNEKIDWDGFLMLKKKKI